MLLPDPMVVKLQDMNLIPISNEVGNDTYCV